jgi:endonuclease/exonuclease/phosphatase family metal-dependent hydrolase
MNPSLRILALGVSFLFAASCSDNKERNIIVDRSPFIEMHFAYDARSIDKVVVAAQQFAKSNKMDFLLARKTLPAGDFNATAASSDLNLKVMHSGSIDHGTAVIFAVARNQPSAADLKKAHDFACVVGGPCR